MVLDPWLEQKFFSQNLPNTEDIDGSLDPSTTESAMDLSMRTTRRSTQQPDRFKPPAGTECGLNVIDIDDDHEQHVAQHTVDDDPEDADYKGPTPRPKFSARGALKKVRPEDMTHEKLFHAYCELEQNKKQTDSTLKEIRMKRTEERKVCAGEKTQRIKLQGEQKKLREENQALRQQLAQQKADFDATSQQQKIEFARAQEDWISKIDMQRYPCLPDNVLQNKFQELYNKCRDWARRWLDDDFVDGATGQFERVMTQCCNPKDTLLLPHATRYMKSRKDVAVRLMGAARLSRLVNEFFFASPFSLFNDKERPILERLYGLYERGRYFNIIPMPGLTQTDNEKKACVWRAETMRLHRACMGVPVLELRPERIQSERLRSLCNRSAKQMLNDLKPGITDDIRSNSTQMEPLVELRQICTDAALLSFEMFSQKSRFGILPHKDLCATPFSAASEVHQAHMAMGLEEDDNSLDGQDAQLILVPALTVSGNEDGEHLEMRKTVYKSVVFIQRDWLPEALALRYAQDQYARVGSVFDSDSGKSYRTGADSRQILQNQRERSGSSDSARKRPKLENHRSSSCVNDRADISAADAPVSRIWSTHTLATSSPEDRSRNTWSNSPSKGLAHSSQDLVLENRAKPLGVLGLAPGTKVTRLRTYPAARVATNGSEPSERLAALVEQAVEPNSVDRKREEEHRARKPAAPAHCPESNEEAKKAKVGNETSYGNLSNPNLLLTDI